MRFQNQNDEELIDADKAQEEEDEVSAAGMHVLDGDDESDEEGGEEGPSEVGEVETVTVIPLDESDEEEDLPKDGLDELEKMAAALEEEPPEVDEADYE